MTTFEFNLELDRRVSEEADMDAIYARCRDATIVTDGDATVVHFDREADTLDDALRTAVADLNAAGCRVTRVELDVDSLLAQSV